MALIDHVWRHKILNVLLETRTFLILYQQLKFEGCNVNFPNVSRLLSNIKVANEEQITLRYQEITCALNKKFRDTESKTSNQLQVGSYGRWTAIKGISDLDMLYIMPSSKWEDYKNGGQSKLLKDTKDAILARYPRTTVFVDRLVVCVQYTNFHVEVQPVFKQEDGSYKYPDTKNGGSWKITKPQAELDEMQNMNNAKIEICVVYARWLELGK